MKKRLFITMVLVLVVAISCAALLVGCSKDKKDDSANGIFKGVDTEDFNAVKEAITNASEDLENITLLYTEYDTPGEGSLIVQKIAEKEALIVFDEYNLINYFVLEDDGTTTNYGVKEDGTWVYEPRYYEADYQLYTFEKGEMLFVFEMMTADTVEYDSENKCFRSIYDGEKIELKVTDKGYCVTMYYNGEIYTTFEFVDYNNTTIEKPDGVDGARQIQEGESFPTIF